jgi:AraC-like DNA-binding protein
MSTPIWTIPLHRSPGLLNIGQVTHGRKLYEKWENLHFWCIHLYGYDAELGINGQWYEIHPGMLSIVPPRTVLEYRFQGLSSHIYGHFSLGKEREDSPRMAAMSDTGSSYDRMFDELQKIIGLSSTNMARAQICLWNLLWDCAAGVKPSSDSSRPHTAVEQTMQLIELRLSEPISVAELSRDVGMSHNHLTRLFREARGTTVIGYILQRRMERARHLLAHSNLPIKAVARQVGIADLHLFNKTIRRLLGCSPRLFRERHSV